MRSLLALVVAALMFQVGTAGYAQHARPAVNHRPLKKRRARVRAREHTPRSLATDEDDEMVLAPRPPALFHFALG
jgi:hypothetical protein